MNIEKENISKNKKLQNTEKQLSGKRLLLKNLKSSLLDSQKQNNIDDEEIIFLLKRL